MDAYRTEFTASKAAADAARVASRTAIENTQKAYAKIVDVAVHEYDYVCIYEDYLDEIKQYLTTDSPVYHGLLFVPCDGVTCDRDNTWVATYEQAKRIFTFDPFEVNSNPYGTPEDAKIQMIAELEELKTQQAAVSVYGQQDYLQDLGDSEITAFSRIHTCNNICYCYCEDTDNLPCAIMTCILLKLKQ